MVQGDLLLFGAGDTALVNKTLDRVRQYTAGSLGVSARVTPQPARTLRVPPSPGQDCSLDA